MGIIELLPNKTKIYSFILLCLVQSKQHYS